MSIYLVSKEYLDEEHKEILEKISTIRVRIKALEDEKIYNLSQQIYLSKLRGSRENFKEDYSPEQKQMISERETVVKNQRSDYVIDALIDKLKLEIPILEKVFLEIPFHREPLYLYRPHIYMNNINGSCIHGSLGTETTKDAKKYLYENSQYATPNVIIKYDENSIPIQLIRKVATSETGGQIITVIQDVIVDAVEQEKVKPKTVSKPLFPTDVRRWKCSCGAENYHELLSCRLCNHPKPIENLATVENTKKSLIDKIKGKL
jgi:hypothetical protein